MFLLIRTWTIFDFIYALTGTYFLLSGEYYFCTKCKMAAHPFKSKCEEGETPDDTKSLLFLNEMKVRLRQDSRKSISDSRFLIPDF